MGRGPKGDDGYSFPVAVPLQRCRCRFLILSHSIRFDSTQQWDALILQLQELYRSRTSCSGQVVSYERGGNGMHKMSISSFSNMSILRMEEICISRSTSTCDSYLHLQIQLVRFIGPPPFLLIHTYIHIYSRCRFSFHLNIFESGCGSGVQRNFSTKS